MVRPAPKNVYRVALAKSHSGSGHISRLLLQDLGQTIQQRLLGL